ncbi:unnamed protein product [Discosporangium mesarthrocarpum]
MGGLGQNLQHIDWDLDKLPKFEKNFYIEHPDVSNRESGFAAQWRNEHQIVIQGEGIPKPVMTFEEASMPEYVLKEVLKQGFSKPTPIQSQGWPMALLGRDMVGISATGSGKTLAFLLPAMIHINAQVWHNPSIVFLPCGRATERGCLLLHEQVREAPCLPSAVVTGFKHSLSPPCLLPIHIFLATL